MITANQCLTATRVDIDTLASLNEQWQALAGDCFMQHPAWILSAFQHYHLKQPSVDCSPHAALRVQDSSGQLNGCGLWFRQQSHGLNWWKLAGSGAICSDYVTVPAIQGRETEVGIALAEWFQTQPSGLLGWPTAIEIEGHLQTCPLWQSFVSCLEHAGWASDCVEVEGAWKLDLPNDWTTYETLLHKSRRRKARKAIKLIQQNKFCHRVARCSGAIQQAWPDFIRLHQKRRQFLNQPGCFSDPDFEIFLRKATLELAEQGSAWMSIVQHSNGQPLAMLLMFDSGRHAFMYQSGIDTDCLQDEPGHLVNAATIQYCIEKGIETFDFLRGDEPYKRGWLANRHALYRTRLFAPGWTGRGIASAIKLRRSILSWRKAETCQIDLQDED